MTVAPISEFSLVFAAIGLRLDHISHEVLGLITLVGTITIGASSYMILYSHSLYKHLSPLLDCFNWKQKKKQPDELKFDRLRAPDARR